MAIICSDNFNGPNGGMAGRTLNNALGGTASATWVVTGNPWNIVSNEAHSFNYAAIAIVDVPTATKMRALIRTAASNNRSAVIASASSNGFGPGVIAYLSTANDALVIREMNSGDIFGPDKNSVGVSVSNGVPYFIEVERVGNVYTARLYNADGVTLMGNVSYDFGGTSFSGTHWGMTNYSGDDIQALNATFYEPDAPPGGNALLLQLMQHGQFNGGLL